jgi:hypothetical protein
MHGMTLRDYFAAKALGSPNIFAADEPISSCEAELGLPRGTYDYRRHFKLLIAKRAYDYADAMLEARKAKP